MGQELVTSMSYSLRRSYHSRRRNRDRRHRNEDTPLYRWLCGAPVLEPYIWPLNTAFSSIRICCPAKSRPRRHRTRPAHYPFGGKGSLP